jgi:hypothetical protein
MVKKAHDVKAAEALLKAAFSSERKGGRYSNAKKNIYEPYMSYQEIANHIGISREAVAAIEKSALRKIRKILKMRGLDADSFFGKN